MRIGIVITMYDEFDVVKSSLTNIKNSTNKFNVVLIHSNNNKCNDNNYIKSIIQHFDGHLNLSLRYILNTNKDYNNRSYNA